MPADLGTVYRPISLLYLAVKVLEHLLKPKLNSLPLSPNQHGPHPNHSTVSTHLPLAHIKTQGLNQVYALTLSPHRNKTKRWLYLPTPKGVQPTADTTLPSLPLFMIE